MLDSGLAHLAPPPILISALHYEWRTLDEAFDRCREEFGLDGIEFSVAEGAGRPHLVEGEYGRIAELGRAYGLQLSGHVWGDLPRLGAEGAARQLRAWLGIAREAALGHVIVHGGSHDDRAAGLALMGDVFARVADEYAAAGVVLCVENHYAWEYHDCHELYGTAEELEDLFAQARSPGLGFCLDYGHSHMSGNTPELLERIGHRLAYTHLADNLGEHDDHLMFGEGTVPWREVLAATRDLGYRGPLTIEFPVRDNLEGLRRCVDITRNVWGR
ncbi:MAG: sugar phosphate isomerase/epimerase [Armatimonadetes bacterium]|nr:sugar phosphate isomerase/epimerase [Armatimonadota bacterium]